MSQNGQTHLKNLAANDFYRTPPVPAFLLYFAVCAESLEHLLKKVEGLLSCTFVVNFQKKASMIVNKFLNKLEAATLILNTSSIVDV